MKKIAALLAVFSVAFIAFLAIPYMSRMNISFENINYNASELYFLGRDFIIGNGQKICLDFSGSPEAEVYFNNISLGKANSNHLCLENASYGKNLINLSYQGKSISYYATKENYSCSQSNGIYFDAQLPAEAFPGKPVEVIFNVKNTFCRGTTYFITLHGNGLESQLFEISLARGEEKNLTRKIIFHSPGNATVTFELGEKVIAKAVYVNEDFHAMRLAFGIASFSIMLYMLYRKFGSDGIAYSLAIFSAFLVLAPSILDFFSLPIPFFAEMSLAMLAILIIWRLK